MTRVLQATVAHRLGISESYVSHLCAGRRMPSLRLIDKIVSEYDLEFTEVYSAYRAGPDEFSALLREKIFDDND